MTDINRNSEAMRRVDATGIGPGELHLSNPGDGPKEFISLQTTTSMAGLLGRMIERYESRINELISQRDSLSLEIEDFQKCVQGMKAAVAVYEDKAPKKRQARKSATKRRPRKVKIDPVDEAIAEIAKETVSKVVDEANSGLDSLNTPS